MVVDLLGLSDIGLDCSCNEPEEGFDWPSNSDNILTLLVTRLEATTRLV